MFKDESLLGKFQAWRMRRRLKKAENELAAKAQVRPEEVKALAEYFEEEDRYDDILMSLGSDYLVERYTKTGALLVMLLYREVLCHGDRGVPFVIQGRQGLSAVFAHSGSPFWLPESWIPDLDPNNGIPHKTWSKTVLPSNSPFISREWITISEEAIREMAPSLSKAFLINWSKRETVTFLRDWEPGDVILKVCEAENIAVALDGEAEHGYVEGHAQGDQGWTELNEKLKLFEEGTYRSVFNFDWDKDHRKWYTLCIRPGLPYKFRPLNEVRVENYLNEEMSKFESLVTQIRERNKSNYFSATNIKKLTVFDKGGVGYPLNSVRTSCDGHIKQAYTDCGKLLDVFYIMSDKESNELFKLDK